MLWKKITPLIVSFLGIFLISVAHELLWHFFDLKPVLLDVYLYLSIFMGITFLASIVNYAIFSQFLKKDSVLQSGRSVDITIHGGGIGNGIVFLIGVVAFCSAWIVWGIYKAYSSTGLISGDSFEAMLSYGVVGHSFAILFSIVPIIYLSLLIVQTAVGKFLLLVMLVFVLSLLVVKQVKYWVIIPIVAIIITDYYYHQVNVVKRLLYMLCCVFLIITLFFGVYFFQIASSGYDVWGNFSFVFYDVGYHFLGYLFSGLIVFSGVITDGYVDALEYRSYCAVFEAQCNIFSITFDGSLWSESFFLIDFYPIDNLFGKTGNVPTLWGVFLLQLGWLSFFIYFLISCVFYLLFVLAHRYLSFLFLYITIASFMFMSWFASYFALLSFYEVSILNLVFSLIFSRLLNGTFFR
jgi:hypothetical protein